MYNQLESLPLSYDKHEKNWQKSAEEIAKFILDGLENRQQFFEFVCGEKVDDNKSGRWQEQLSNLITKAQKRIGHQIDSKKLLMDAREVILNQAENGQLLKIKAYEKFCDLSPEDFKLSI